MKKNNFMKSISIVLIVTVIGKVFGFLKQIVLASYFGANLDTDLFFTSYFFIYEISVAVFFTLSTAMLITYGRVKKVSKLRTNKLFSSTCIFFLIIAVLICLILFLFPNLFVGLIAPGYSNINMLPVYIRTLSPMVIMFCIKSLYDSILEYEKIFLPTKTFSVILNLFLVIFTVLFSKKYGIISLVIAVNFAFILQSLISLFCAKKYVKFSITKFWKNDDFKKLIKLFFPLFIGGAITELNSIVDRSIASKLLIGSVSFITYGASINEIVTVLLIGTVISVFYSYISSILIDDEKQKAEKYIKKVLKTMLIILIPLNALFIIYSDSIVKAIYMRGSFDLDAVKNTSLIVIGYAIGFIPLMFRDVLIRVHYAFNDSKSPMFNGIITVILNITFSILLANIFGIIGIPIATSISSIASAIMAFYTIRKHINILPKLTNFKNYFKMLILLIISFIICYICKYYIAYNYFINLLIGITVLFVIYIILLILFNIISFYDIKKIFNKVVKTNENNC